VGGCFGVGCFGVRRRGLVCVSGREAACHQLLPNTTASRIKPIQCNPIPDNPKPPPPHPLPLSQMNQTQRRLRRPLPRRLQVRLLPAAPPRPELDGRGCIQGPHARAAGGAGPPERCKGQGGAAGGHLPKCQGGAAAGALGGWPMRGGAWFVEGVGGFGWGWRWRVQASRLAALVSSAETQCSNAQQM